MALRRGGKLSAAPEDIADYRDLERIGHGGFSVVYRARSDRLGRVVALKVLSADLRDERGADRFRREIQLVNRLSGHPHVVNVVDIGVARSGRPYIAMEYFPGGSLKMRLAQAGPLPVADALSIGVKVAHALAAAHDAGVLHRDIKPENILLSQYGEPALADFGIGRLTDRSSTGTSARTDALTVQHTAPEVLAGERSSVASDIYSLGSTLYELLAGQPPFHRDTDEGIAPMMLRIVNDDPPEPDRADLPAPVVDVLRRALSKQPRDRFATATEFATQLRQAAGLPEEPAPVAAVGHLVPSETLLRADRLVQPEQEPAGQRGRIRWRWAIVALAAVVMVAGGSVAAAATVTRHRTPRHVNAVSDPGTPHSTAPVPGTPGTSPSRPSVVTSTTPAVTSAPAVPVRNQSSAPPAPSHLTVRAANQSTIRLSWADNSHGRASTQINNGERSVTAAAGTTSYDWGGLAAGTYMCFKIRAVFLSGPDSGRTSGYVPAASPFYVCATTPPSTASSSAAPSNPRASAVSPDTIRVTWTDNSGGRARFEINNGESSRYVGAGVTSYDWGGLAPGRYMCVKIRAYDGSGNVSGFVPSTSPYYVCATTPH